MPFSRYAIYYTPPAGAFAAFGAAWLGRDADTGRPVPHPAIADLPAPVAQLTETPRKYGFHATIKPPFRLARRTDQAELETAFAAFCLGARPVTLDGLHIAPMGRFLALVPDNPNPALNDLAADAVRQLDRFRAAPGPGDLARYRKPGLSPENEALFLRWGYPFVMEAFRFHMTLTGKLAKADLAPVQHALAPLLDKVTPRPFTIGCLSLMGAYDSGCFQLIHRLPLGPGQTP